MKRDSEALKLRPKDFALRVFIAPFRELKKRESWVPSFFAAAHRSVQTTEWRAAEGLGLNRRQIRNRVGEADETVFGLELFAEGNIFPAEKLRDLVQEANELVSIFVSSVRTAKGVQSDL
jgi:hypothetical protein